MPNEQKKCCENCWNDNFPSAYGKCVKPNCPCHTPTEETECTVCDGSGFVLGTQLCTNCMTFTKTVSKWEEIEKIDIEELGKYVHEYKDGKPWTSSIDPVLASRQVAEKVNEIIDSLSSLKQKLEALSPTKTNKE